jgi:NADPH-dependent F420 reductase
MGSRGAVGILGGSGPAGRGLGLRLAASGWEVVLGSRARERAEEAAASAGQAAGVTLRGATNEEAARLPYVVVATPFDGAPATVRALKEHLEGKVVISMVNAMTRVAGEFQALLPVRGSVAASLQSILPKSRVSAAFHHLPAGTLAALDEVLDADVLVCADDEAAGEETVAMVDSIPGLRGIRAGTLASASAVEAITPVLLNVNIRYKAHVALRLAGLGEHA